MLSIKVTKYFLLFSIITIISNPIIAYRILVVYPSPSHSHQIVQEAISKGLAAAGHQVTIIAPRAFATTKSNITQIVTESVNEIWRNVDVTKGISAVDFLHILTQIMPVMMDETLLDAGTQKLLENNEKLTYDAVIIENVGFMSSYAIAEHFNASLIGLISMEMFPELHAAMGNPGHPILHRPNILRVASTSGFINRCFAFYAYLRHLYWFHYELLPASDWVIEKHFPHLNTNSRQLLHRMDFAIEGQSSVLCNTRPLLPNTIQLSFLHVKPVQALPDDLKNYLDQSKYGVVYVSFGSNVKSSSLKNDTLNTLIETFRGLKYDVLWKFESDYLPNKPDNVKIDKWLPQQDILGKKWFIKNVHLENEKFLDCLMKREDVTNF